MTMSVVALQVHEPGARADELLAAVARKLDLRGLSPDSSGYIGPIMLQMPAVHARQLIEQALEDAGDQGRLIVSVLYPE